MNKLLIVLLALGSISNLFAQDFKENLLINNHEAVSSFLLKVASLKDISESDKVVVIYAQTRSSYTAKYYSKQSYSLDGLEYFCQRGVREAQKTPKSDRGILYEGESYRSQESGLTILCLGEVFSKVLAFTQEDEVRTELSLTDFTIEKVAHLQIGQSLNTHMHTIICLPGKAGKNQLSNSTFKHRKSSKYISRTSRGSSTLKILFDDEQIRYHDQTRMHGKLFVTATCGHYMAY